jgi:hypothetical protein
MNHKNIGSKQAEKLARKKFGERAMVARQGKTFYIGRRRADFLGFHFMDFYGIGRSWAEALRDAGISIPEAAPYFPPTTVQHMIEKDGMPDVMPEEVGE